MNKQPKKVSVRHTPVEAKDLNNYQGMFPKKNCKCCYGRGWDYMITIDGEKYHNICRCVKVQNGTLTCGIHWNNENN